jgi:hypothetical protein
VHHFSFTSTYLKEKDFVTLHADFVNFSRLPVSQERIIRGEGALFRELSDILRVFLSLQPVRCFRAPPLLTPGDSN